LIYEIKNWKLYFDHFNYRVPGEKETYTVIEFLVKVTLKIQLKEYSIYSLF